MCETGKNEPVMKAALVVGAVLMMGFFVLVIAYLQPTNVGNNAIRILIVIGNPNHTTVFQLTNRTNDRI